MPTVLNIPPDVETYDFKCGQKTLTFTNLNRVFWPQLHKTKRELLLYYAAVSNVLLPHLRDRGLAIKKYPNGIEGKLVLVKQLPDYHPPWLKACPVIRSPGNIIDSPMAQDLASLLWLVNLGCVDFSQTVIRCDDIKRPDCICFDLHPIPPAEFRQVQEAALLINDFLQKKNINAYAKTNGLGSIHIQVPIYRKLYQKEVWRTAKQVARNMANQYPNLLNADFAIKKRRPGQVTVGYNQNAAGRMFASAYSLRPGPEATVATPVSWEELASGVDESQFTIDSLPSRIERIGDLFKPLLRAGSRYSPEELL